MADEYTGERKRRIPVYQDGRICVYEPRRVAKNVYLYAVRELATGRVATFHGVPLRGMDPQDVGRFLRVNGYGALRRKNGLLSHGITVMSC